MQLCMLLVVCLPQQRSQTGEPTEQLGKHLDTHHMILMTLYES